MNKTQIGVLLLGFGAPDSLKAIEPFLRNVFSSQGKILPPQVFDKYLRETTKRYKAIGGKSPLPEITRRQARALEKKLNEESNNFKVYVGMRNWHPFVKQTLKDIVSGEIKKVVVLSLSPQYNSFTTRSNIQEVKRIFSQISTGQDVIYIDSWCGNSTYLDVLSDKVRQELEIFKAERNQALVLFSAHSLPKKLIEQGDPYLRELRATIAGVIRRVGKLNWQLCFQSRGMRGEWLEPDISTVIGKLGKEGRKAVLIVPVSFIADNVEVLYDIDIALRKQARDAGIIMFRRTDCLNDSPKFIEALAEIVVEYASKMN